MNHAPRTARLVTRIFPNGIARAAFAAILLGSLAAGLLAGCNGSTPSSGSSAPAPEAATTNSRDFGNYVLHFNALRTDQLTPDVARNYGIIRSPNRVLLNVSIIHKVKGTLGVPVAGTVTAKAVNLNGQLKDLVVRELREGDAIYYIGDVPIADNEVLTFTIDAVPANETRKLSVKFQRDFS